MCRFTAAQPRAARAIQRTKRSLTTSLFSLTVFFFIEAYFLDYLILANSPRTKLLNYFVLPTISASFFRHDGKIYHKGPFQTHLLLLLCVLLWLFTESGALRILDVPSNQYVSLSVERISFRQHYKIKLLSLITYLNYSAVITYQKVKTLMFLSRNVELNNFSNKVLFAHYRHAHSAFNKQSYFNFAKNATTIL